MQRHHLLPRQILTKRCFSRLLGALGRTRIRFDDFRSNGLLLPCAEVRALQLGIPLHRGPHRHYNAIVIERVGAIERSWSGTSLRDPHAAIEDALSRLGWLQAALRRRLLEGHRTPLKHNRNDPLGTGYDFAELDAMAEGLWQATD